MTDAERSQKLETALQAMIGSLHFRLALLQVENEDLRAHGASPAERAGGQAATRRAVEE